MDPAVIHRDATHLQSEIRQLRNQQFLLSAAALTLFGAIATILLRGDIETPSTATVGYQRSVLAFVLLVLLFVLFVLVKRILNLILVMSAYMQIRKWSQWEVDYSVYSGKARSQARRYVSQTAMHALVFITLGSLAVLIVALTSLSRVWDAQGTITFIALCLALCVYTTLVAGMGFGGWFFDVDAVEDRWRRALDLDSN